MARYTGFVFVLFVSLGFNGRPGSARAGGIQHAVDGEIGRRAFEDVTAFYFDDHLDFPTRKEAVQDLSAPDAAAAERAADYLLAVLKQLRDDEMNGRSEPWPVAFESGYAKDERSPTRFARVLIANDLAEKAPLPQIIPLARWLVEFDPLPKNQLTGLAILKRLRDTEFEPIARELLDGPHPNQEITRQLLAEVQRRKLVGLKPVVIPLCRHYRTVVRNAATDAAASLGATPLGDFVPEQRFTPALDRRLRDIAAMVMPQIPQDAPWVSLVENLDEIRNARQEPRESAGWLISQDDKETRLIDWFGQESRWKQSEAAVKRIPFIDHITQLLDKSKNGGIDIDQRSRHGVRVSSESISMPELILAAWCRVRGETKVAVRILLPRLDQIEDDRTLTTVVQEDLGWSDHEEMLHAFTVARDYEKTLAIATHLSKPLFAGFAYQARCKRLAEQLPERREDFNGFRLPPPAEWIEHKKSLSRIQQIEYLAARVRLINDVQMSQPGGINYSSPQTAGQVVFGRTSTATSPVEVINPYNELQSMEIIVGEIPSLAPFLADENFMLAYSYWRSFARGRELHKASWAISQVVNTAAMRSLSRQEAFELLDDAGRSKRLAEINDWCARNSSKSREQLALETLASTTNHHEFRWIVEHAIDAKYQKAGPIVAKRMEQMAFGSSWQEVLAKCCYRLNSKETVSSARKWITNSDQGVRFWSAATLLRDGDKKNLEGLAAMREILGSEDKEHWYSLAVRPLLENGREEPAALACGILTSASLIDLEEYRDILRRLFLAGRRECLDYLLNRLDKDSPSHSHRPVSEETKNNYVIGDDVAELISYWWRDDFQYPIDGSDEVRRNSREQLKLWLRHQFELILAGKPPQMRTELDPESWPRGFVDSP